MASNPIPSPVPDDGGFERLYRAHVETVYRYAFSITGNASDAEDVTQTTFLNAYRAYEAGERPRAGENWLVTIAQNVCRQRARNSARRPREVAFTEEIAEAPAPSSDAPTAADIRRAVRHLPADEQTVIAMRELQGRTNAEIANAIGLTTAATERLLFRARRSLREQLTETLTCLEAEAAINRKLDGESSRPENAALRLHLRDCVRCAALARTYRAQGGLLGKLGSAAFPTSFLPAGGLGAKVALIAAAAAVSGGGYAVVEHAEPAPRAPHVPAQAKPSVPAHHPTRPVAKQSAPTNHRLVRSSRSRSWAPNARAPLPTVKPASSHDDPPIAFHEPTTLAPPAAANGDAGGGTEPAGPAVEPTDEPRSPPAAPTTPALTTPAPPHQAQEAGLVVAEHAPSPPPPVDAVPGVAPTDPGSQAEDHRVTPDPADPPDLPDPPSRP